MPELPDDLAAVVQTALAEDIGSGDISAELIPADAQSTAQVISAKTRCCVVRPGSTKFSGSWMQVCP